MIFEIITVKITEETGEKEIRNFRRLIAKDAEEAKIKMILRDRITEEDLKNWEILVRPFVQWSKN